MNPIILIIVLIASTLIGYKLISNVPMSGMNALSGVTVIGAIAAAGLSFKFGHDGKLILGQIFGGLAIILATINVVGGFGVTHRMLRMFSKKKKGGDQ